MRLVPGLLILALVAVGCAGIGPYPTAELTTLNPAWVTHFKIDWSAETEAAGTRRVRGYVHNGFGQEAGSVEILAQALDASGAVVAQRITYAGTIPGLSRGYFEVRNLPAAEQYKVTVWWFTFEQAQGWM